MFYDLKVKHTEPRQLSNIQIVESCNSPLFEYWTVVLAQCAWLLNCRTSELDGFSWQNSTPCKHPELAEIIAPSGVSGRDITNQIKWSLRDRSLITVPNSTNSHQNVSHYCLKFSIMSLAVTLSGAIILYSADRCWPRLGCKQHAHTFFTKTLWFHD